MRLARRPQTEWPNGKKICATLTVAFEAFMRGGHFKKANDYLAQHGRKPIDWAQVE